MNVIRQVVQSAFSGNFACKKAVNNVSWGKSYSCTQCRILCL